MQNPDVTAFISQQPAYFQPIFKALRQLISQEAPPHMHEFIQYGIPFYGYYGRLCYLNLRQGIVELGVCQGAFLSNEQALLVGQGKQVRHIQLQSLADINPEKMREVLQEAMIWNELKKKKLSK
jgi:hypothetical protein